jgi:hypothetical protein
MKKGSPDLIARIARCCEGLVYISETDSPVQVFTADKVAALTADTMRAVAHAPAAVRVEERDLQEFFTRLTDAQPWHDEQERVQRKKFLELQHILEEDLHDLKVFKVGEIRLTVYAVGLDGNNNVIGVSMHAVET